MVTAHGAYVEDLKRESRSGQGRILRAALSVPITEFDAALFDLRKIGKLESLAEAGEDATVKLATAKRRLANTQTNLERLQNLQRERNAALRDALSLEKEIAQAQETVADAQRQQDQLLSTTAQAHITVMLLEEYREPFNANVSGASLKLRNSLVEGFSAIFSSVAVVFSVFFEYGLPLLFWVVLLFWPVRLLWRRLHRSVATPVSA